MHSFTIQASLTLLSLPFVLGITLAQSHDKDAMDARLHVPTEIKWTAGPSSLAPGAMMAILEGDPTKEGLFVIRLKMPDGYRVAPHTHPQVERVTVIAGTLHIGMGEKFDEKATRAMPAGSYGSWPAGMKHFGWMKGETILQLHGTGPWEVKYLNPADDPRK